MFVRVFLFGFFWMYKRIVFKFVLLRDFHKYEQVKFVLSSCMLCLYLEMIMRGFRLGAIVLDLTMCLLRFLGFPIVSWNVCEGFSFRGFFFWCAGELRSNLCFFGFFRTMNKLNLYPSSWMLCLYLEMIMRCFRLGVIVLDSTVGLLRFLGFAAVSWNVCERFSFWFFLDMQENCVQIYISSGFSEIWIG